MRVWTSGIILGFVLMLPGALFAQGAIGGTVKDSTGAVLPGVTVEASSDALIERTRSALTDANGQYQIVNLRPGTYAVTFTLAGFNSLKREGLVLTGSNTLPVSVELSVGSVEETLTVTGASPVVDIQNTRQQAVLTREVLDVIPRARNAQNTGMLLPGMVADGSANGVTHDVGGSSGENQVVLSIHGSQNNDQTLQMDGFPVHVYDASTSMSGIQYSDAQVQEFNFEFSSISAETGAGGVRVNVVPKEGGNAFRPSLFANGTGRMLTANNLTDKIKATGLTDTDHVLKIWDFNPSLGGPIRKDKIWFFTTYRNWGVSKQPSATYFESGDPFTVHPLTLDSSRRAEDPQRYWSILGRLTYQANRKNKFGLYFDKQDRILEYWRVSNTVLPGNATTQSWPHEWVSQGKWTSTMSSHVLVEAGFSTDVQHYRTRPTATSAPGAIPINDTGLGVSYNAATGNALSAYYDSITHQHATRASLSYVTGSHAFKAGYVEQFGHWDRNQFSYTDFIVRLNNGAPTSVVLSATPQNASYDMNADLGLYVQDQWRLNRLTLNGGLRFDYFNTSIPPQSAPAGAFVGARSFPEIKNVPNWKDISPRIGGVWDVFGTGKTAVKASVNRYVAAQTAAFAQTINPMTALATDTRAWTDPNKDGIPQPSEFGPTTNAAFGLPVFSSHPDPALANGWGARGANWEYAAGVQHEVVPGLSGSATFTRRSYRNLTWTRNTLLTSNDYSPFTVTNPYTHQPLTLYNQSVATRARVDNLVTFAPDDRRVFNGVDFVANGRYHRLLVYGGITMGVTDTRTCTAGTVNPNLLINCDVKLPFAGETQYKTVFSYQLPSDMQLSGAFQSTPGPRIQGNYTVTSAIAGLTITQTSITTNLVVPGTLYGDRLEQLDLRVSKGVKVGRTRMVGNVELFNALNGAAVLVLNNTFGANWQKPQNVLLGRMLKFGIQADF
jgi:carboxypeptidase family protein